MQILREFFEKNRMLFYYSEVGRQGVPESPKNYIK